MINESLATLLSGLAGGLLAVLFCGSVSRWVPQVATAKVQRYWLGSIGRSSFWPMRSFSVDC